MLRKSLRASKLALSAAALSVVALSATMAVQAQDGPDARPPLLLMGTVPIFWGEAEDLTDLVRGAASTHWARPVLERRFQLQPLDTLTSDQLARHRFLLMAQPRTLSAGENIALNGWVRAGGHVLLLADPMMTGDSRFAIGDRRRPQDVALLSPILTHWGLDLQFDDTALPGVVSQDAGITAIPVNLPGRLVLREGGSCEVLGEGIAARCALGRGMALVLADAALVDHAGPYPGAEAGLTALIDSIFSGNGEIAGGAAGQAENAAIPGLSSPQSRAKRGSASP
jgi:hypothetical protein